MSLVSEAIAQQLLQDAAAVMDNGDVINKGTYTSTVLYGVNNIVRYNGTSYMCTVPSQGNLPTDTAHWQPIAEKGDTGDKGDKGDKGDQGDPGTDGIDYSTEEAARVIAEDDRVAAESSRVTAESNRTSAESTRVSNETTRVTNETSRGSAETARVSAESSRVTAETTRVTNETSRIAHDTAYTLLEAYNSGHSYVPLNKVTDSGSTYQCILATTGNAPTNTAYWVKIAAKGLDGTGAGTVTSVTSANSDIGVATSTDTPILTLNSGTGANQIVKRDSSGNIADLTNISNLTSTVGHGLSVLNTTQSSPAIPTFYGRTLSNILGKDGNCESLTPFTTSGTVALSSTQFKGGTQSIKITCAAGTSNAYEDISYPLDTAKQYIIGGWMYVESWTSGTIQLRLYDNGGFTNLRYSASANTSTIGSWQFVYVKIPTSNTLVGTGFRFYMGVGVNSTWAAYFDSIRLYELSASDYAAIGTTYTTDAAIDAFIPMVNGVQHNRCPAIRKSGKNLLPPFTEWTLHADAVVTSPYLLTMVATGVYHGSYYSVPVILGQTYTVSTTSRTAISRLVVWKDTTRTVSIASGTASSYTFIVDSSFNGYATIQVDNGGTSSGTFTFTNPQLELGSTATAWEAKNDDYLYAVKDAAGNPVKIGSDVSRTVFDEVYYRDGAWRKLNRLKLDVPLTGALTWTNTSYSIGNKIAYIPLSVGKDQTVSLVKYNGQIVPSKLYYTTSENVYMHSGGNTYIVVPNTDTGFDNAYVPIATEVKAYFYGWKVNGYTTGTTVTNEASGSIAAAGTYALLHAGKYKSVTITKSTDNTTFVAAVEGTDYTINYNLTNALLTNSTAGALYYKITYTYGVVANGWVSVVDGTTAPSTNTIAYVSANQAVGYTPYSLSYQLAVSTEEIVEVEGSIGLQNGGNQIEVLEGMVVREAVTPYLSSGTYYINTQNSSAYLSKRASQIINVYRENDIDSGWSKAINGASNGLGIATLPSANFDSTKNYYVTYKIQDTYLYTSNLAQVDLTYAANLGSTVSQLVKGLTDNNSHDSVQDWRLLVDEAYSDDIRFDLNAHLALTNSVSESLLTTTSQTTVLSYTPTTLGNYVIYVSARVITAATNLTVTITYTDVGGAQTYTIFPLASVPTGTNQIGLPAFIHSVASSAISVKVTAGTANQAYISASIVGVSA